MATRLAREILSLLNKGEQSLSPIVELGWDHVQILDEIARLQFSGLLVREGATLSLTEAGVEVLSNLPRRRLRIPGPRDSVRVEAIPPGSVYVPGRLALEGVREAVSTVGVSRGGDESSS